MTPADEGRHEATTDPWWAEHFVFDLWTPDAALGAFTWMTLLPVQRRAWYWCALVRVGHPVLHVADIDLPLPTAGLRVRTDGLWADHHCEAPFEQWTVRNECHAVELDDPAEALGRAYGTAAPIALDIEWYATAPHEPTDGGYQQSGEAHAVIEVNGGPLEVVGAASRWHTWGPPRPPSVAPQGEGPPSAYLRGPGSLEIARTLTSSGWHTASRGSVAAS